MKFVSLFHDVSTANRFRILNIPWIGWEKSKKKALHTNKTNKCIITQDKNAKVTNYNTILYLNDSSIEIEGTELTQSLIGDQYDMIRCEIGGGVTTIRNKAFYNCNNLNYVEIPSNVETVEDNAFTGDNLTTVTINSNSVMNSANNVSNLTRKFGRARSVRKYVIGNDVTKIGNFAFYKVFFDISVLISNNVTDIGTYAFSESEITHVTIPDGIVNINNGAFYKCTSLNSVVIGSNVETIGEDVFNGCENLESITIHSPVIASVGRTAFYRLYGLREIKICVNDVQTWFNKTWNPSEILPKHYVFYIKDEKITNLTISDNIPNNAFCICDSLNTVIINDSVTSIGAYAFADTSLSSVNIGNNVTSIGEYAFADTSLSSVNIPDSVTSIGGSAFARCTSLTSINIPNSVTSIGGSAFVGCTSLSSINIPDTSIHIGNYAFRLCRVLSSITIPNNTNIYIGVNAFEDCSALLSITIPSNVTHIGGAFAGYEGLTILQQLNSNYTSTLYNSDLNFLSATYSLKINSVAANTFDGDYNCSVIITKGNANKSTTMTYNIYTDNLTVHDLMAAAADNVTIINLYHLDESPWA